MNRIIHIPYPEGSHRLSSEEFLAAVDRRIAEEDPQPGDWVVIDNFTIREVSRILRGRRDLGEGKYE